LEAGTTVTIRALGELALRVNDFPKMVAFYRDVVGLEVFADDVEGLVFLTIAEAVDGHPQLFALFDRNVEVGQERSTLDHFAFIIDIADYDTQKQRLEGLGVPLFLREFPHFHWRSLFFADPEGNTIEFVAYDETVR
jgi:catechol-2,3-dioxygenase